MANLTATEFKQVVDIVRQRLDHFLSGILASLERQRPLPQPEPAVGISTNAASGRAAARIEPDAEDIRQAREHRLARLRVHAHQSAPEPEREIIVQRQSGDARRCYRLEKSMSLMWRDVGVSRVPRGFRQVALSISCLSPIVRSPDTLFTIKIASLIFLPE